jgi:hypothetical protein
MATGRAGTLERIADLVGPTDLEVEDLGNGWPGLAQLRVEATLVPVALFVGAVGLSHRDRDDVERRFQNPSGNHPITPQAGRTSLLLGLWEDDPKVTVSSPLLVSADASRRISHATRFSVFTGLATLLEADATGWAEGVSGAGETIRAFLPPLLPTSVQIDQAGVSLPSNHIQAAILASGLFTVRGTPTAPARLASASRARMAASRLVRSAAFSRAVIDAYEGRCAMCGLDSGLVEAAHIYPVAAPGSVDHVYNGLALCPNHHTAFDKHLIAANGANGLIHVHPDLSDASKNAGNAALAILLSGTFSNLTSPRNGELDPRAAMFDQRFTHFAGRYDWLQ